MTDQELLTLYQKRCETAITKTDEKYGKLCRSISMGILHDKRDCEECINDTWLTLWNEIPPKEPNPFRAFICRVTKNLSLKRYQFNHAEKRNSTYETSLEELTECTGLEGQTETLPEEDNAIGEQLQYQELVQLINRFLSDLSADKRILFLRRYWFLHSVKELAEDYQISEKHASMKLTRIRQQLKTFLEKEGYSL